MGEERQLSEDWGDLREVGAVPDRGKGRTAEQVERDKQRARRRYPSEDKRAGRKISPTLSRTLVNRLRAICKAQGYVGPGGEGIIASSVIEDLLWAAVEAYDRGDLGQEEQVVETRPVLRWRSSE